MAGHSMKVGSSTPKLLRQIRAWSKGKNVVLRELDPDKWKNNKTVGQEDSKCQEHLIKVNAREIWGTPFRKTENSS